MQRSKIGLILNRMLEIVWFPYIMSSKLILQTKFQNTINGICSFVYLPALPFCSSVIICYCTLIFYLKWVSAFAILSIRHKINARNCEMSIIVWIVTQIIIILYYNYTKQNQLRSFWILTAWYEHIRLCQLCNT